MLELTQEQLNDLYFEDELELNRVVLTIVEQGSWEHQHKFQSKEIIFTDGTKHYSGFIYRSGSDYSDWDYQDDGNADICEVVLQEQTIKVWTRV